MSTNSEVFEMLNGAIRGASAEVRAAYDARFEALHQIYRALYLQAAREWADQILDNLAQSVKIYDTGKVLGIDIVRTNNDGLLPIRKISIYHAGNVILELSCSEQQDKPVGILATASCVAYFAEADVVREGLFFQEAQMGRLDGLSKFLSSAIGDKLMLPPKAPETHVVHTPVL